MKTLKNKKRTLRWLAASGLLVAVGALTIAASSPDFVMGRNLQILYNMFRNLSLFYVDPIDSDAMLADAAEGMVSRLDPYTGLIPESEMADFEILTTGKYGGIGAQIRKSGEYVMVARPYRGFPADRAGLVIGDIFLEIDGESVRGMDVAEVSSRLKGVSGTEVQLKVRKLLTGRGETLSLIRDRIVISGVTFSDVIADSIGYIVHSDFTEDCSSDIRNAVMSMKKERGIKGLIFDLRGNGGGILQEAVKILSMFVPKGTNVVSMQGRDSFGNATFTTPTEPIDTGIPIVVLVNGSSASAAEIVAGAFQDLDRGVLVGQRTFGKGLVQATMPLGYNAYLKLTTARYYTPSGRCIQALDYAHRNEDGTVSEVPDSLIQTFFTLNGRRVYDGGGIMPDVVMPDNYFSTFSIMLFNEGHIEDFANLYYKTHRIAIDPETFALTDADYDAFIAFMADKEITYESATQQALDLLRKRAERDKYLDRIAGELDTIQARIRENKQADLLAFRDDIIRLLESEIVLRYAYKEGVTRHNLRSDAEVAEALRLLADPERYKAILASQDTAKK